MERAFTGPLNEEEGVVKNRHRLQNATQNTTDVSDPPGAAKERYWRLGMPLWQRENCRLSTRGRISWLRTAGDEREDEGEGVCWMARWIDEGASARRLGVVFVFVSSRLM